MTTYMYGIKETAAMTKRFVKGNIRKPLISLFPYWLVFSFIVAMDNTEKPTYLTLAIIPVTYISILLATNFHRAYMRNHETGAINPLKPTRDDGRFIGVTFIILFLLAIIATVMGGIGYAIGAQTGLVIAILLFIPVSLFIGLRLAFVYPDRATGGTLPLKAAFQMSRGLVWRILITPIVAGWKWLLAAALWAGASAIIATIIAPKVLDENGIAVPDMNSLTFKITNFVLSIPAQYCVMFYYTALVVTVLSNYYLWAKNNPYRK